jgi:hypothetical protein
MNRNLGLVAALLLTLCGCAKRSSPPIKIESCLPRYSSTGSFRAAIFRFHNVSNKLIIGVRISVDASYADIPVRIPAGTIHTYSASNVEPWRRSPECEVWEVVYEDGKRWEQPSKGPWIP